MIILNILYSRAAMSLVRGRPSQGKRRGRPRSKSAPAVLRSPQKIRKRKQWPEESMQKALDAVKSGVSVMRAAREHGVPRQTLRDRVSGKYSTVLSQDQNHICHQWKRRNWQIT